MVVHDIGHGFFFLYSLTVVRDSVTYLRIIRLLRKSDYILPKIKVAEQETKLGENERYVLKYTSRIFF